MATPQDKLRQMREKKSELGWPSGYYKSEEIAKGNASPSKLSPKETKRAADIINERRKLDQGKALARAENSVKRAAKKAAAARVAKAVSGGTKPKAAPKPTATKKPGTVKITASATTSGGGKKTTSVTGASSMANKPKKVTSKPVKKTGM